MKKVLFVFLLLAGFTQAQVFDPPIDSTKRYHLREFSQSAHANANILNEDKQIIDSTLYHLIVFLDTLQHQLVYDTTIVYDTLYPLETPLVLKTSKYAADTNSFVTTAQTDTILITKLKVTDFFFVTAVYPAGANDILSVELLTGKAIIHRLASGTSGLKYIWRWIRRQ